MLLHGAIVFDRGEWLFGAFAGSLDSGIPGRRGMIGVVELGEQTHQRVLRASFQLFGKRCLEQLASAALEDLGRTNNGRDK